MILQTPTPNLKKSIQFYHSLGFDMLEHDGKHYARENGATIEINPERVARAGVKMYQTSWEDMAGKLSSICHVEKIKEGYLLSDPSNVWIYLIEGEMDDNLSAAEVEPSSLGKFAGMSVESIDVKKSVELWTALGFVHDSGSIDQGWASHRHESGMHVSIMKPNMCPHLFFNPSVTYFNSGKNLEVVKKIRDAGVEITEEITMFNKEGLVDNVILRDPGGFGFFVFND